MTTIDDILNEKEVIYIFGYGSLTWKPDFEYDHQFIGFIKGYERRFWQGSTYHRGTEEKPGRCLTLTKVENGICWGLTYEVRGPEKIADALDYLNVREQALGGYEVYVVPVFPLGQDNGKPMYSVVYVATPQCRGFLGDGPILTLAEDIASSMGKVGHNTEYLFRLIDFMKDNLPDIEEEHLFSLDKKVRKIIGLPSERWNDLLKIESFRRLVKPPDYKAKWKHAINEMMSMNRGTDRWFNLLERIKISKESGMNELEHIDL